MACRPAQRNRAADPGGINPVLVKFADAIPGEETIVDQEISAEAFGPVEDMPGRIGDDFRLAAMGKTSLPASTLRRAAVAMAVRGHSALKAMRPLNSCAMASTQRLMPNLAMV